ncbi:MAG: hypothetical protein QW112_01865 [Candidatus Micrarchaeia archaeon]
MAPRRKRKLGLRKENRWLTILIIIAILIIAAIIIANIAPVSAFLASLLNGQAFGDGNPGQVTVNIVYTKGKG